MLYFFACPVKVASPAVILFRVSLGRLMAWLIQSRAHLEHFV
jgi:hypothetical protein